MITKMVPQAFSRVLRNVRKVEARKARKAATPGMSYHNTFVCELLFSGPGASPPHKYVREL